MIDIEKNTSTYTPIFTDTTSTHSSQWRKLHLKGEFSGQWFHPDPPKTQGWWGETDPFVQWFPR